MDPERERIYDDLRGLVRGDVRADDVFLQLYASDASLYEIKPLAVVRPKSLADVVATVKYAAENRVPIFPRGAGSGLAGESLGRGIVIDFSCHMRSILSIDERQARVQPGVVHARLNAQLRTVRRQFGPDPSMSSVTTMGGVIAIDAGGSHWLKYGSARRHVDRLQIVLADGSTIEAGREGLSGENMSPATRKGQLIAALVDLLKREASTIAAHRPKTRVNRFGYQLADVLTGDSLDLARLISGSEGTLALITEATLDTQPLPKHRAVGLLFFDRLESAARAVMEITPFEPSACDLMDRRHLSLAREGLRVYDRLIPAQTEAALLVEHEGDRLSEARSRLAHTVDRVRRRRRLAFHAAQAHDPAEAELFWRLAQKVVPTLYRLKGSTRPLPCVEDLAVPPEALPDFLVRMQNVLKQHQVTASLFSHAGHGQLHLRPFLDPADPADIARLTPLAASLYQEVLAVGGTISGEHGAGLSRTQFLRQQFGPLVDVFREVKRIFDPQDLFNPGKLFSDDPDLLVKNLRATAVSLRARPDRNGAPQAAAAAPASDVAPAGAAAPITLGHASANIKNGAAPASPERSATPGGEDPAPAAPGETSGGALSDARSGGPPSGGASIGGAASSTSGAMAAVNPTSLAAASPEAAPAGFKLQFSWSSDELLIAARQCNGCGACRSQLPDVRMCPIFRFAPAEESSPRAKANLIRGLLTGQLDAQQPLDDSFKEIADLCVHCHMCRKECPASVDIPKLMAEAKSAHLEVHGQSFSRWALASVDTLCALGSRFRPLANWALSHRGARWLLEKTFGIAHARKLPRFAPRTFLRIAARRRWTRPPRQSKRKALYFVDTYVNYHDPQLGEALVAVLEHNGVAVYAHPQQQASGMPLIAVGALARARKVAEHNVALLAEAVRQGYHIIATEPSAVMCLTHEYPLLVDDDDARLVAANVSEACDYLWRLHQQGALQLDFRPFNMTLGYHLPCHLKALDVGSPGENLLRLIPGLVVKRLEKGCSGMAGAYGLARENFRSSLRAGRELIHGMRSPAIQAGVTECSSCKLQMEQGADKPTTHPLKALAVAYNLMPELEASFTAHSEELIVT